MFSSFSGRLLGGRASPLAQKALQGGAADLQQVRNAASMKALKARMRSVQNMQKITKAMKMVAAAKLKHDTRRMELAIPFSRPVQNLMDRLPREDQSGPITVMGLTSDKGLCGGVNTQVAKTSRIIIQEEEAKGNAAKFMCVGAKGAASLKRLYGDRFAITFEDCAKLPWTFTTASIVAERIIQMKPKRFKMVSNEYVSMVVYNTVPMQVVTHDLATTMDKAEWSKAMDVYSFEPSIYEVWDDLHEFYIGSIIFARYLEGATSEQSARMSAMDSASKNAGEMLEKISLIYNRARQAKITTELCEIISGASAV